MNQFRIECSEVNYFTVLVEADTKEEAQELARANINSFDIEDEYTSEWVIETIEELWTISADSQPVYKVSTSTPQGCYFCYTKYMSTLHHESLLDTCFDEAWENFREHNKLTVDELNWLCNNTLGTLDAIEKQARRLFEDLCQWTLAD